MNVEHDPAERLSHGLCSHDALENGWIPFPVQPLRTASIAYDLVIPHLVTSLAPGA